MNISSTRVKMVLGIVSVGLVGMVLMVLLGDKVLGYVGWPWNLMREQPSIRPQEYPPLGSPVGSVPFSAENWTKEKTTIIPTIYSALLAEKIYRNNCGFCHGENGIGDGPVASKLQRTPEDLTSWYVQYRKESDLFHRIAQPSGIMPPFRDRLSKEETWNVGRYILNVFTPTDPPPWQLSVKAEPKVIGEILYESLNCNRCHGKEREIETAGIPPTLEYAGSKLKSGWIIDFLLNPHLIRWKADGVRPNIRMPAFRFSHREAEAIAEYLSGFTDEERFGPEAVHKTGDVAEGKELFEVYQCLGCHTLNGRGNRIGPDLTKIGSRLQSGYLFKFLMAPKEIIPGTAMKDFDLWEEEALALVHFLQTLK